MSAKLEEYVYFHTKLIVIIDVVNKAFIDIHRKCFYKNFRTSRKESLEQCFCIINYFLRPCLESTTTFLSFFGDQDHQLLVIGYFSASNLRKA